MDGPTQRLRRNARTLTALTAAAVFLLAAAQSRADPLTAQTQIYWADTATGSIGRASVLDPSDGNPALITGATAPRGLALDGTYLYWTGSASDGVFLGTIGRGRLNGGGVDLSFVRTAGTPSGLAVGVNTIYWTQKVGSGGFVGRVRRDGYFPEQSLYDADGGTTPCGLAAGPDSLFWSNPGAPGSLSRAPIGGGGSQTPLGPAADPCGIAITRDHLYWVNRGDGTIGRANPDGSSPEPAFLSGLPGQPCGIAVDGAHVYWTWKDGAGGHIGQASLDGTVDTTNFVNGLVDPCGVAVTPTIRVTPMQEDFAPVEVRARSGEATIRVENNSSSAYDNVAADLVGANPRDFEVVSDGCAAGLIPAGGACVVRVRFIPQRIGPRVAQLRLSGTAGNDPVLIGLTGRGTADRKPPALRAVRIRPPAFAVRAPGSGARIRFRLSEAARVRFTVLRAGHRLGRFRAAGSKGSNSRAFSGRLHGRALAPGAYRLRVVARDPAGNRSRGRTLTFRVTG
jgi:hypothetical protein